MLPLSLRICQCMRQKTEVLAAISNLRVEQNLVHLGRILHFSQKVVEVTLNTSLLAKFQCYQYFVGFKGIRKYNEAKILSNLNSVRSKNKHVFDDQCFPGIVNKVVRIVF